MKDAYREVYNHIDSREAIPAELLVNLSREGSVNDESNPLAKTTLLHRAVSQRNINALKQILGLEGLNVNAQDAVGDTPLHRATRMELLEASALLIDHGADLDLINHEGQRAFDFRVEYVARIAERIQLLMSNQQEISRFEQHIASIIPRQQPQIDFGGGDEVYEPARRLSEEDEMRPQSPVAHPAAAGGENFVQREAARGGLRKSKIIHGCLIS